MNVICSDGIGGICYALSFIDLYKKHVGLYEDVHLHVICSKSVYELVQWLNMRKPLCDTVTWNCSYNDDLLLCKEVKKETGGETYCLTPDRFCVSEYRPPFERWAFGWQQVKENQFLSDVFNVRPLCSKNIFLGFQSSQDNLHPQLSEIVERLLMEFTDYNFDFINVTKWSDKDNINYGFSHLTSFYENLHVREPSHNISSDFTTMLTNYQYIVCTDNGLSNLAYFAGKRRFLIDMRYGNPAIYMRWRQSLNDLIDGNRSAIEIARTIALCIKYPELNGTPKEWVASRQSNVKSMLGSLIYKNIDKGILDKYSNLP